MNNIPNLDPLYDEVVAFVKENQGEKGYIDCQPYQENPGDIIYTVVYNYESGWGEERMVFGVRVTNDEEGEDLEICYEPWMRTYRTIYSEQDFKEADWQSVRWSDVYYIHTLFNIAECIEEYA